jgi:hypothetical protein
VRFIRNAPDAYAQMIGNESTDVAVGKGFFDSCGLFTWCQATDDHYKPPNSSNALVMRPSNPPRNVALLRNLESVAIASQFLEASQEVARNRRLSTRDDLKARKEPQGFGRHRATITTQRGNSFEGSIRKCGGAGYAGSIG